MIQTVTRIVADYVLKNELSHQKRVGYRLAFVDLPDDWVQGYAMVDMTLTWHSYGLPIRGLNYFTVGSIEHGKTTRFNPHSDLYQAWLGGYIFESKKPLHWQSDGYLRLAEADQKGWLRRFGAVSPAMDFGKLTKLNDFVIDDHPATLYSWSGVTRSDVGASSHGIIMRVMMDGMADMMNTLTPGLKVKGKNFVPRRSYRRQPFEELLISGYMVLVNISSTTKAVLYVCMVGDNQPDHVVMKRLILDHLKLQSVS